MESEHNVLQPNRQAGGIEQETMRLEDLVGGSPPMADLAHSVRKAPRCSCTVLVLGENGTGKGMVARAIHPHGQRYGQRFVVVNCGAIPKSLVESDDSVTNESAFTGAHRQKKGKFEAADAGTIFLDEMARPELHMGRTHEKSVGIVRKISGCTEEDPYKQSVD